MRQRQEERTGRTGVNCGCCPGVSYDLIVASGGITGSYTTVIKPDSLFGFVVQSADSIRLLGQFLSEAGFTPQVNRSIAYTNATLAVLRRTAGCLPQYRRSSRTASRRIRRLLRGRRPSPMRPPRRWASTMRLH